MKKILLIDDSDTYTWCLQKYLQHRGYPVKTACTLKEARAAIQEEMPLVVCCNLDLPDGSGMDFLNEVRAADKELPFILASCHDKDDYEQEAMRRGATLCMDKMKGLLLQSRTFGSARGTPCKGRIYSTFRCKRRGDCPSDYG